MRNVCRACRMQKCIDVGMRRQDVDTDTFDSAFKAEYYLPSVQPNTQTYLPMANFHTRHAAISELLFSNRIDEATVMSLMTKASMNVTPANRFSAVSATDFPQLAMIVGEFRRLHANQRNIYLTSHPDDIYSEAPLRTIWKAEYIRMEDETLPLVAEFIRNVIPQYEHLPDDKKLSTLKSFTPELLFYHKVFMTVTTFPSDADTRIATHYGYYVDLHNLYSFFEGLQMPERRIK
ncbi:zinc finger protein [Aphelenchoides avenae]|nr:zinc finger protein [Aphelenchus avenae]